MNYHQIYSVDEIERVFSEVLKILELQELQIKQHIAREIDIIQAKQLEGTYLEIRKDQGQIDKFNLHKKNKLKQEDISNKTRNNNLSLRHQSNNTSQPSKIKRQQLKSRLKLQMEQKNKLSSQKPVTTKTSKDPTTIVPQESSGKNSSNTSFQSNTLSAKQSPHIKEDSDKSTGGNIKNNELLQQIDLKKVFQNKLMYSPSFCHNMLMYYVLVLENVIRYQTRLINEERFYEVFYKGADKFVFSTDFQSMLLNLTKISSKHSHAKQLQQKLIRQIKFAKILTNSLMTASNNQKKTNNQSESQNLAQKKIDPHKILTYLINYSFVGDKQESENRIKKQTNSELKDLELSKAKHHSPNNKLRHLLLRYAQMIGSQRNESSGQKIIISPEQSKNNAETKCSNQQNSLKDGTKQKPVFIDDGLIELAIQNKGFINSLKSLYVKEKSKNSKQPQPIYQILERIFQTFNHFYNQKTQKSKTIN